MAVGSIALFPILLLFGGFSLPLGLPPLPEDPAISRTAPPECLVYTSWAGTATPDAQSTNHTEQLLAEPEVQKLLLGIDGAIKAGIKKSAQQGAAEAEIAKEVYPLAKTLLTRPAAIFVAKVALGPQGIPDVQGGAIFNLAEKSADVSAALDRLQKNVPPDAVEKVEIAGASFQRIKQAPIPQITWGIRGKYLIVSVGEGAVEGILQRAEAQPPAWLVEIRKQLPVERFSTLTYFNVKQTVAQFAPLGGPRVTQALGAVGLSNVDYLASVTGLDSKGTVARTLVAIDGQPQGIFHLATAKPLTAADLSPIPRDATIAAAGRLDTSAALKLFLAQLQKIDPAAPRNVTQGIEDMRKDFGIDLREDLLKPLGDVWCVYNSPGEGGLLVTGLTGVVQVKDHDRLEATLNKQIALYDDSVEPSATGQDKADPDMQNNSPRRSASRIRKTTFAGRVVYHFDVPSNGFPLAPAWCLTEKELIVATFPQNIKSYLSRGKDFQSLAAVPEIAHALEGGAMALNYCDTRQVAEFAYPLLCVGGNAISSKLSQEGIPLDASLMPSAAAIFPHLQPSTGMVRRTAAGIEFETRGPLAGIGGGPLLPVAAFGFLGLRHTSVPTAVRAEPVIELPVPAK